MHLFECTLHINCSSPVQAGAVVPRGARHADDAVNDALALRLGAAVRVREADALVCLQPLCLALRKRTLFQRFFKPCSQLPTLVFPPSRHRAPAYSQQQLTPTHNQTLRCSNATNFTQERRERMAARNLEEGPWAVSWGMRQRLLLPRRVPRDARPCVHAAGEGVWPLCGAGALRRCSCQAATSGRPFATVPLTLSSSPSRKHVVSAIRPATSIHCVPRNVRDFLATILLSMSSCVQAIDELVAMPERPMSLYEGLAGAVCFWADLLAPDLSHFPGYELPPRISAPLVRSANNQGVAQMHRNGAHGGVLSGVPPRRDANGMATSYAPPPCRSADRGLGSRRRQRSTAAAMRTARRRRATHRSAGRARPRGSRKRSTAARPSDRRASTASTVARRARSTSCRRRWRRCRRGRARGAASARPAATSGAAAARATCTAAAA
jgi:hypothetical protein